MNKKFAEYEQLDLAAINAEMQELWKKENTFEQSVETRKDNKPFIFLKVRLLQMELLAFIMLWLVL